MTLRRGILISLAIVVIAAVILHLNGRIWICKCGTISLWTGDVMSSENSQQISDWYTPSHVLHGLLFYWFGAALLRNWSMGSRLVLATLVEALWEVAENSSYIINLYRENTVSLDYFGDSILNSVCDIGAMWIGFWLAARIPVWASIALFIAAELFVGYMIRDGLTLNVIMLLAPQDWIREWQSEIWQPEAALLPVLLSSARNFSAPHCDLHKGRIDHKILL